jgi:hypothetical protein
VFSKSRGVVLSLTRGHNGIRMEIQPGPKWRYFCLHISITSFSGGRDQEGHGSKPALAYSSQDPISTNLRKKRVGGVAQGAGPECQPQSTKKKKLHFNYNKLKTIGISYLMGE